MGDDARGAGPAGSGGLSGRADRSPRGRVRPCSGGAARATPRRSRSPACRGSASPIRICRCSRPTGSWIGSWRPGGLRGRGRAAGAGERTRARLVGGRVERYTEIRVARRDDRRSLIAMAVSAGSTHSTRACPRRRRHVGAAAAHVTLYTAPGGKGIGICDDRELESLAAPAPGARRRDPARAHRRGVGR